MRPSAPSTVPANTAPCGIGWHFLHIPAEVAADEGACSAPVCSGTGRHDEQANAAIAAKVAAIRAGVDFLSDFRLPIVSLPVYITVRDSAVNSPENFRSLQDFGSLRA